MYSDYISWELYCISQLILGIFFPTHHDSDFPCFYFKCKVFLILPQLTTPNFSPMSSGFALPPAEHAAFAVNSRLLSCLVTEGLLRAVYLDIKSPNAAGVLVILSTNVMVAQPITRALRPGDIFALVPLHNAPVCRPQSSGKHGKMVSLVDPLDMLPVVYELVETTSNRVHVPFFIVALLYDYSRIWAG